MSNLSVSILKSWVLTYALPFHHDQLLGWCVCGAVTLHSQTLLLRSDSQPRAHRFVCEVRIIYPFYTYLHFFYLAFLLLAILRSSYSCSLPSVLLLVTTSCHQQTLPSPCLPSSQVIYERVEQQSFSTDPRITPPVISLRLFLLPSVPFY